jgi:DNA-binding CsgD family transcriptional regulator/tetratricopeptide (TPR) repeat protein
MGGTTLREPFVGRAELVRRLVHSECRAQLLVGEPGIGKSRLLEVVGDARVAAFGGIRVETSVYDLNVGLSFESLREIVFALDRRLRLAHDVVERVRGADDRSLVRHVRDAIAAASTYGPICVAVDDIFRMPPAGLEAFAYLVDRLQDLPVRWHVTSHMEGQVASAFARLTRANLLETHVVPSLSFGECSELVRSIEPTDDGARLREIFARSGGNPLFAKLLARADSPWHIATLRAAVAQRIGGLTSEASRLGLLIATGRAATREQLAVVSDTSRETINAACDELVLRGLIVTVPGGGLRFQHDLIAEAIVAGATEPARARAYETWLHYATDSAERIRYLEGAGRWREVVDELIIEGWRAAEFGQPDAETFASRALSIVASGDVRRYEIYAFRARLHVELGRFEEARDDFARFLVGREEMDALAFAKSYGRFAVAAAPEFRSAGLPILPDLLDRALSEFPAAYAVLAHARALVLYCEGDVTAALDVLRMAKRGPASDLERIRQDIWEAYLGVQLDPGQDARATSVLAEAARHADAIDATADAARAYFMCAFIAHRADDLAAAEAWCRRGLATREPKPRSVTVALRSQLCEHLLLSGRAWEALGILLEATEETQFLRRDARVTVGAILALAQGLTGSLEAARITLASIDDAGVSPVIFHSIEVIRGIIFEMASQMDAAARAYDRVIENATVVETSLAYAYIGRARIALADRDVATLERLCASATIAQANGPKSLSVAALISGFIALLAGEAGALAETLPAIDANRSVYDAAFVRLVVGEVAGDATCLRDAAAAFDAIGTQTLADRARAAARRHGLRLGSPRNPSRSLSERSRSVAIGIAAGQTNAEIAAALHLSPRTVEKHVSSLLSHFDVRSRVEIAGIILRGELAERQAPP